MCQPGCVSCVTLRCPGKACLSIGARSRAADTSRCPPSPVSLCHTLTPSWASVTAHCGPPCPDQTSPSPLLVLGRITMTGDRLWPACFNPFHSPKSKSHTCRRPVRQTCRPLSPERGQPCTRCAWSPGLRGQQREMGVRFSALRAPGRQPPPKRGRHLSAWSGFAELRMETAVPAAPSSGK